jgi:hypothetical protein
VITAVAILPILFFIEYGLIGLSGLLSSVVSALGLIASLLLWGIQFLISPVYARLVVMGVPVSRFLE